MFIRITTYAGPKDIEILDWERTERMLSNVPCDHLNVSFPPFYPADFKSNFEPIYDYLRRTLETLMNKVALPEKEDNGKHWIYRHHDWYSGYKGR